MLNLLLIFNILALTVVCANNKASFFLPNLKKPDGFEGNVFNRDYLVINSNSNWSQLAEGEVECTSKLFEGQCAKIVSGLKRILLVDGEESVEFKKLSIELLLETALQLQNGQTFTRQFYLQAWTRFPTNFLHVEQIDTLWFGSLLFVVSNKNSSSSSSFSLPLLSTITLDCDLFDGVAASFLLHHHHHPQPTFSVAERVAKAVTKLSSNLGPFDLASGKISGNEHSLLLSFLEPSTLKQRTSSAGFSTSFISQSSNSEMVTDALKSLISREKRIECPNPLLVNGSQMSILSCEIMVDSENVTINSIHGESSAFFNCDERGTIYVSLSVSLLQQIVWPLDIISSDVSLLRLSQTLGKYFHVSGQRVGSLKSLSSESSESHLVITSLPGNIFSPMSSGGTIAQDTKEINLNEISSLLSFICNKIQTSSSSLNQIAKSKFSSDELQNILQQYLEQTSFPTKIGFLTFYAAQKSSVVRISNVINDGNEAVIHWDIILEDSRHYVSPDSEPEASSQFFTLCATIEHNYIGFAISGVLRASVSFSLDQSAETIKIDDFQWEAVANTTISCWANFGMENNFQATYQLHSKQLHYQYQYRFQEQQLLFWYSTGYDGGILQNRKWISLDSQGITISIQKTSSKIQEQLQFVSPDSPLATFGLVSSHSTLTIADAIKTGLDHLYFGDTHLDFGLSYRNILLETFQSAGAMNIQIWTFAQISEDSFEVTISWESVHLFTLPDSDKAGYNSIAPLSNLLIPTVVKTIVQFSFSSSWGYLKKIQVEGKGTSFGWTLPIRSGMRASEDISKTIATLSVNLPLQSDLQIEIVGKMERGSNFKYQVNSTFASTVSKAKSVSVFKEENGNGYGQSLSPTDVVSSITSIPKIYDALMLSTNSFNFQPLGTSLRTLESKLNENWIMLMNHLKRSSSSSISEEETIGTTTTIISLPTNAIDDIIQFAPNEETLITFKACHLSIESKSNAEDLANSIQESINECDPLLKKLIKITFKSFSETACSILINSKIPGLFSRFDIYSLNGQIFKNSSWHEPFLPNALSISDLYAIMYLNLYDNDDNNIRPDYSQYFSSSTQIKYIGVDEVGGKGLISEDIKDFYNSSVPYYSFPIMFKLQQKSFNSIGQTKFISQDKTISIEFIERENDSTLTFINASLNGEIVIPLICAPSSSSTIILTTLFNSSLETSTAIVPENPNNTFTLHVSVEKHYDKNFSTVEVINWDIPITLSPGMKVIEALLKKNESVKKQLPKELQRMIDISFKPEDRMDYDQIQFNFHLNIFQNDSLYYPIEISISDSVIPGIDSSLFGMIHRTKKQTCVLTKKMQAILESNTTKTGKSIGNIGLIPTSSQLTTAEGYVKLNFSTIHQFEWLSELFKTAVLNNVTNFNSVFHASSDTICIVEEQNVTLGINISLADRNDDFIMIIRFTHNKTAEKFTDLLENGYSYNLTLLNISESHRHALTTVSTFNTSSVCKVGQIAQKSMQQILQSKAANTAIPFIKNTFSSIHSGIVDSYFDSLVSGTCGPKSEITLEHFCSLLSGSFVQCNLILSNESISIELEILTESVKKLSFLFDSKRILGGWSTIPNGFGLGNEIDASVGAFGKIVISLNFLPDGTLSEPFLTEESVLCLSTKVRIQKEMLISFGPLTVAMKPITLNIDLHLQAKWNNSIGELKTTTTLFGAASIEEASLKMSDNDCFMHISVLDIEDYASGKKLPNFEGFCGNGKSLVETLLEKIGQLDFANQIISDTTMVIERLFNEITEKIFLGLFDLFDIDVTFLNPKELLIFIKKLYDTIFGIDIQKIIVSELSQLKKGEILENKTVEYFTDLLNEIWKNYLVEPIPIPQVTPDRKPLIWKIHMKSITKHPILNQKLGFDIDSHGIASLDAECAPILEVDWEMKFNLVYYYEHGFKVEFPASIPTFSTNMTLISKSCSLTGTVLFAAVGLIDTDLLLIGSLEVSHQSSQNPLSFFTRNSAEDIWLMNVDYFMINASINGKIELGFAGIFTKQATADSLPSLPHLQADFFADWFFDFSEDKKRNSSPLQLHFGNPRFCIGTLFTMFLKHTSSEINKYLEKPKKVLEILQYKLPGGEIYLGGRGNTLQAIKVFCEIETGEICDFSNLQYWVDVFYQIIEDLADIDKTAQDIGDDGCSNVFSPFSNFTLFPQDPQLTPHGAEYDPLNLVFHPRIPSDTRQLLNNKVHKWGMKTQGQIGIHIDLLEHPIRTFVDVLLLGKDSPLITLSWPNVSMFFDQYKEFGPFWPFPPVYVNLYAGASIVIQLPPISLGSGGLVCAIKEHNVGCIFEALGMSTEVWVVDATLYVGGGISIGINLFLIEFSGGADVYISFNTKIRPVNVNGNAFVSFAQLSRQFQKYGVSGVVDIDMTLKGGLHLYIRACVNLFLTHYCFNIVNWHFEVTLWHEEMYPPLEGRIANENGIINTNEIGQYQTLSISTYGSSTNSAVSIVPYNYGPPHTSRPLSKTGTLTFSTDNGCKPYNIQLLGFDQDIEFPPCSLLSVTFHQDSYLNSHWILISQDSITPEQRIPLRFSTQIAIVSLINPSLSIQYTIFGLPGMVVNLETEKLSKIDLEGNPINYQNRLLNISGNAQDLNWNISNTEIEIYTNEIVGINALESTQNRVQFPNSSLSKITVQPHCTKDTQIKVYQVPQERSLEVRCREGNCTILLPTCSELLGKSLLFGSTKSTTWVNSSIEAIPGQNLNITTGKGFIHIQGHVIVFPLQNSLVELYYVLFKSFHVIGKKNTISHMNILASSFERYEVFLSNQEGGEMTVEINKCTTTAQIVLYLEGNGTFNINLGYDEGRISALGGCTITVFGEPNNQTSTISINATKENYTLMEDINHGALRISENNGIISPILLFWNNINRLIYYHGTGSHKVLMTSGTLGTEMILEFPNTTNENCFNDIQILATTNTVLIKGNTKSIRIGAEVQSGLMNHPLYSVFGTIVLSSHEKAIVYLESGDNCPSVNYTMNDFCLNIDPPFSLISEISEWMCATYLKQIGLPCRSKCNVIYKPGLINEFHIATGKSNDKFTGNNTNSKVFFSSGKGSDTLILEDSQQYFEAHLGCGPDVSIVRNVSASMIDFGKDDDVDSLTFFYSPQFPPHILPGDRISPSNAELSSFIQIDNRDARDLFAIQHCQTEKESDNFHGTKTTIFIRNEQPASFIQYEQQSDTIYIVQYMAFMSRIAFYARWSLNPEIIANDTEVWMNVTDFSIPCIAMVNGERNSNGFGGVMISSAVKTIPIDITFQSKSSPNPSGIIDVDRKIQLWLNSVDHSGIVVENDYCPRQITVLSSPSLADLLFDFPSHCNVQLETIQNNVIVLNGFANVSNLIVTEEKATVISAGNSAICSMDYSLIKKESIQYINGCLKMHSIHPQNHSLVYSNWIKQILINKGLNSSRTNEQCICETIKSDSLILQNFYNNDIVIDSLDSKLTTNKLMLIGSLENVFIIGTTNETKDKNFWNNTTIQGNELSVTLSNGGTFQLNINSIRKTNVSITVETFLPESIFIVKKSENNENISWNFIGTQKSDKNSNFIANVNIYDFGVIVSVNSAASQNANFLPYIQVASGINTTLEATIFSNDSSNKTNKLPSRELDFGNNGSFIHLFEGNKTILNLIWGFLTSCKLFINDKSMVIITLQPLQSVEEKPILKIGSETSVWAKIDKNINHEGSVMLNNFCVSLCSMCSVEARFNHGNCRSLKSEQLCEKLATLTIIGTLPLNDSFYSCGNPYSTSSDYENSFWNSSSNDFSDSSVVEEKPICSVVINSKSDPLPDLPEDSLFPLIVVWVLIGLCVFVSFLFPFLLGTFKFSFTQEPNWDYINHPGEDKKYKIWGYNMTPSTLIIFSVLVLTGSLWSAIGSSLSINEQETDQRINQWGSLFVSLIQELHHVLFSAFRNCQDGKPYKLPALGLCIFWVVSVLSVLFTVISHKHPRLYKFCTYLIHILVPLGLWLIPHSLTVVAFITESDSWKSSIFTLFCLIIFIPILFQYPFWEALSLKNKSHFDFIRISCQILFGFVLPLSCLILAEIGVLIPFIQLILILILLGISVLFDIRFLIFVLSIFIGLLKLLTICSRVLLALILLKTNWIPLFNGLVLVCLWLAIVLIDIIIPIFTLIWLIYLPKSTSQNERTPLLQDENNMSIQQ